MAVPPFQKFFLPFLKLLNDGNEHGWNEIRQIVSNQFGLTNEDLKDLVPSGRQSRFHIGFTGPRHIYLKLD